MQILLALFCEDMSEVRSFQLDAGIKLVWQAGNQLTVTRGGENQVFTLNGGVVSSIMKFVLSGLPAATGKCQITITSDQRDTTKQLKLISMDTPMLNTGATSFENCFWDCTSLALNPKIFT